MRKKVFICSPFRGDMEGNARKAAAYCRMACEQGFLQKLMGQFSMPEDGEFSEEEMDRYVSHSDKKGYCCRTVLKKVPILLRHFSQKCHYER